MAEAERLLRTVLLVALLHSSPWAPPLSLSGLWGQDQQETSVISTASPASTLSPTSRPSAAATTTRTTPTMFASGQAAGDDSQMDGQDQNEMGDPSLLNPMSNQGYGKEDPPHISISRPNKKSDKTDKKKAAEEAYKNRSMGEQTMQAALQMGVLVSVFLLFAFLFFVQVGVDLFTDSIANLIIEILGRTKELDIEDQDPASLVGTFKRYK